MLKKAMGGIKKHGPVGAVVGAVHKAAEDTAKELGRLDKRVNGSASEETPVDVVPAPLAEAPSADEVYVADKTDVLRAQLESMKVELARKQKELKLYQMKVEETKLSEELAKIDKAVEDAKKASIPVSAPPISAPTPAVSTSVVLTSVVVATTSAEDGTGSAPDALNEMPNNNVDPLGSNSSSDCD